MSSNYKSKYTQQEAEELIAWIDRMKPSGRIDLGHGVVIADLEKFSNQVRHIARTNYANSTFSGQISLMMDVRDHYDKG